MTQIVRLTVKGDEKTVESIRLAADMVLASMKVKNPGFDFEWDECGYIDSVGGHHDSGVGWMPNGRYCGECTHSTCEKCSVWEWELKRQEAKEDNK